MIFRPFCGLRVLLALYTINSNLDFEIFIDHTYIQISLNYWTTNITYLSIDTSIHQTLDLFKYRCKCSKKLSSFSSFSIINQNYTYGNDTFHGKTTDTCNTNDVKVHTDDIGMTYEYIRVTYGWHTSTSEWHTNDMRVHTSGIRMAYHWHADDMRFERKIKLNFVKFFDNSLSKYLIWERNPCMQWLFWVIYKNGKGIWN